LSVLFLIVVLYFSISNSLLSPDFLGFRVPIVVLTLELLYARVVFCSSSLPLERIVVKYWQTDVDGVEKSRFRPSIRQGT